MISVRGHGRPRREIPSVALSVTSFVAPPDSSPPPESEISKQFDRPPGPKSPADISIPKYFENDLQQIFKAVLEARALALAPAPALVVSEVFREKLKARSLDLYCGKFHIDCYNFCQQYENYFATARATGSTRILFATSFLWDRISFRWQKYKQRYDTKTSVPVT